MNIPEICKCGASQVCPLCKILVVAVIAVIVGAIGYFIGRKGKERSASK
ncbi:hypothetical protein ACFL3N_02510 [Candidatus Omnitrophota bacterium]